jgi:hypothetical protein
VSLNVSLTEAILDRFVQCLERAKCAVSL